MSKIYPQRSSYSLRYLYDLTLMLTVKEFKAKYKSTSLGLLWVVVNPLLQVVVLTIVFSVFFRIDIPHYSFYIIAGLMPWTYFYNATLSGTSSIIANRDLIKKVPFPRILLPVSSVGAQLFPVTFALGILTVASVFLFGFRTELLFIPFLLVLETILIVGIVSALSSLEAYYRDVSFMLTAVLLVWFYLNPIFYSLDFVPESLQEYYILNPFVGIVTTFQSALLPSSKLHLQALSISIVESFFLCILGFWIFQKREKFFADWL